MFRVQASRAVATDGTCCRADACAESTIPRDIAFTVPSAERLNTGYRRCRRERRIPRRAAPSRWSTRTSCRFHQHRVALGKNGRRARCVSEALRMMAPEKAVEPDQREDSAGGSSSAIDDEQNMEKKPEEKYRSVSPDNLFFPRFERKQGVVRSRAPAARRSRFEDRSTVAWHIVRALCMRCSRDSRKQGWKVPDRSAGDFGASQPRSSRTLAASRDRSAVPGARDRPSFYAKRLVALRNRSHRRMKM